MSLLDEAWEQREQVIYKDLFGDFWNNIYPLTFDLFKNQFNCEDVDPSWLHNGVFRSPPNTKRKTWLYVSSGMSNPWESEVEEEYSGLGTEFILETEEDESWAIPLVQSLVAFNILLSVGKYGDKPVLCYGDRVPQPIEPNISHLVMGVPTNHPETIKLISGKVDLVQIIGITKNEFDFAKSNNSEALCELLIKNDAYPIMNSKRASVIST